jgi:hypothetical protein
MALLEIADLTVEYDRAVRALQGITLALEQGDSPRSLSA